jgi:hypothetical protein
MRYSFVDTAQQASTGSERPAPALPENEAVAIAELLAAGLMEVLGPMFWAVLIVGFLAAEFALD